jgi:hypothetical protein
MPTSLPIIVRMKKSRRMRWARDIARTEKETREGKGGAYRVLVHEDDVINNLKEKGLEVVDWIHLAQYRNL